MTFLHIGNLFINPNQITHIEEWQSEQCDDPLHDAVISVFMASSEAIRNRYPESDLVSHRQEQVEFRFRGGARQQVIDWLDNQHVIDLEMPQPKGPERAQRTIGFNPLNLPLNGPATENTPTTSNNE